MGKCFWGRLNELNPTPLLYIWENRHFELAPGIPADMSGISLRELK